MLSPDTYVEPQPHRGSGPELWTGARKIAPWAVRRAMRFARGFFPIIPPTDEKLVRLHHEMAIAQRTTDDLELGAFLFGPPFKEKTDLLDLDEALKPVPDMLARGFSTFVIKPSQYIEDVSQLGDFTHSFVEKVDAIRRGLEPFQILSSEDNGFSESF